VNKVTQLDTLTLRYWQDFELATGDLEYLSELLIEEEAPLSVEDLARRLMQKRVDDERAVWEGREAKGRLYQPRDTYAEGDRLVFSALGDASGTVVGMRPGRNPEYGPFQVVRVRMDGDGDVREFASNLSHPHALNFIQSDQGEDLTQDELGVIAATLFDRYGQFVTPALLAGLHKNPEFVNFGGEWFLKGFLVPIQEGHLNLAEAVLDLASGFSEAQDILNVLEMPAETSQAVQMFSLNHALASDSQGRFEFAGTKQVTEWCLPRVAEAKPLRFQRGPTSISLDHVLDDVVEIMPDSASEPAPDGDAQTWSHVLTFYDWYWGHLPYDARAKALLPEPLLANQSCARIHLRASAGGDPFPVVVCYPSDRRLGWWGSAELRDFFESHELAPGATIRVRRGSSSGLADVYEIDWLLGPTSKMETLDYEEGGKPVFRRLSLRCQLDEEMSLPRSRFSALEALSLLDESGRRMTLLLLKTAFQRVAEKLLRGLGIVYRASFSDLYVATNIERPLPATMLEAIFQQGVYPCFYIDAEGYYVHDPGRSEALVNRARLTWSEAILDSQNPKP
jgi:hypothetical protein